MTSSYVAKYFSLLPFTLQSMQPLNKLTSKGLSEVSEGITREMKIVNLCVFLLVLGTEVWCTVSTVKVFKTRSALRGSSLLALYICLHMMLILRLFYCLGLLAMEFSRSDMEYIENLAILAKDLFIAILAWRLMEVIYSFNDSKKCLVKVINVLLWVIIVHIIAYLTLYSLWFTKIISNNNLSIYCSISECVFGIIYIYACIETIRFWKGSNIASGLTGYLRWLFIVMFYMIFALGLRVAINVLEVLKMEKRTEWFYYCKMELVVLVELIPCTMMSVCLYIMAKDFENSEEGLHEAYNDE
eukprot:TRINITY_DN7812_c0_g1_i2.p1 TRINITY_DN7812_c0_g1~~TRINITY_DN7812_c0_g1_i2.p1  ORF type:complete len:300 (-),score=35.00 TRINITY_DN7812_c0_g1_i2:61-960(-)